MDLYLKDPPTFGHISFIVQAVKKGEATGHDMSKIKLLLLYRRSQGGSGPYPIEECSRELCS